MDWRDARMGGHVGPGWEPLVDELHRRLHFIDPDIQVDQVKEKFGGLRYYYRLSTDGTGPITDAMREAFTMGFHPVGKNTVGECVLWLVGEAERAAYWLCEECGRPGHADTWGSGWLKTLCADHGEARRIAKAR